MDNNFSSYNLLQPLHAVNLLLYHMRKVISIYDHKGLQQPSYCQHSCCSISKRKILNARPMITEGKVKWTRTSGKKNTDDTRMGPHIWSYELVVSSLG